LSTGDTPGFFVCPYSNPSGPAWQSGLLLPRVVFERQTCVWCICCMRRVCLRRHVCLSVSLRAHSGFFKRVRPR
jgi:hypothetical protein